MEQEKRSGWYDQYGNVNTRGAWAIAVIVVVSILVFIATLMTVIPGYRVWSQEMRGKAALREAEQNRKIVIEEAKARLEAEQLNAEAEVARAKGMAEAMEIENGQLTPTYNQYLFIRTLEALAQQGDLPQLIYLPSQGMVPVMDLTRPNDVNITMQQEE